MNKYNKYAWIQVAYKGAIDKISTNNKKVKQKEYISDGKYPVIDQGQDFIGGYTNDESKLLDCTLPALVFGDHTKIVKLVNYKFAPGADGVKVIVPVTFFDAKLFEFFTKIVALKIPDKGYARHFQHIEKSEIPLPHLPEQRAIVSKIEQLFSDLDNGINNFKKAQEQLKIYRQAVLKNACEGKLVLTEAELARAEGRDYEPADVLLARILEERREKWNGKGKYKEPVAPDTSGLVKLPEGWKWVSIDQISNLVTDGDHNPPKRVASGIPHLTAKNIRNWQISEEGCTYIIEQDFEKVRKRYLPIGGDIIITCVGTIGRTTIVPENYIFSADRNLAVVRLISEGLTEKLMQFYLNTSAAQNSMGTASGSTAQPHLYLGKIRVFPVPLSPLAEQRRIVAEVERRLSVSDKMEEIITESLGKAEFLRQSILKKAFEGKLLNEKELEEARNAPDWEPAEKLVERIRQEKQIKENNNKPTRRKTHG